MPLTDPFNDDEYETVILHAHMNPGPTCCAATLRVGPGPVEQSWIVFIQHSEFCPEARRQMKDLN